MGRGQQQGRSPARVGVVTRSDWRRSFIDCSILVQNILRQIETNHVDYYRR